jgi:hypothetical protein
MLDLSVDPETSARSLTVSAGGNIVQHIEPDKNDPRIWDIASSKILNMQLLDSRTFKLVTGLDPPETPITPDMYKELGLPFYDLWREDGKEDGVAGLWGSLMGAMEVASKNMKAAAGYGAEGGGGSGSAGAGKLGLLKSGVWGRLDDDYGGNDGHGAGEEEEGFSERSYDFPVVLVDVDDTIPKFKSIVETAGYEEYEDW